MTILLTIRNSFRNLSFTPFKTGTPDGIRSERYRMAAWASLTNFISSGIGLLLLVITVPLVLPYLGPERFGIWMTVASFSGLLSFMDFGVGNGLINGIAEARASNEPGRVARTILHGLIILSVIGICVAIILTVLAVLLPWPRLIKTTSPGLSVEIHATIMIFAALFAIGIPLSGIQKIYHGLQRAWIPNTAKAAGFTISIALVYLLSLAKAGPPMLLLATFGVQTVMPLFLLPLLAREHPGLFTKINMEAWNTHSPSLLHISRLFFMLQIGFLLGWGSDLLIVSSFIGAEEASKLAILQRLFQTITLPLAILNTPLWSAYADAKSRHDKVFIRRTLAKSLKWTFFISSGMSLFLIGCSIWIIPFWTGNIIRIPFFIVVLYGLWTILEATGTALAMFLNGIGEIRAQVICVALFCLVSLPLKLATVANHGISAVVIATIASYTLTIALPYASIFRGRLMEHLR